MSYRTSFCAMSLLTTLLAALASAQAHDENKYPDWSGAWSRIGNPRWDTSKPQWAQEPPLTAEYQAIYDANVADMKAGGQGTDPTYVCLAPGMPRSMIVYHPMEVVITPNSVYFLIDHIHDWRRIYTDGRDWPEEVEPAFGGYSIGKWIDEDDDGRYEVLEIETRHMKGPRAFDATGIPLHRDNKTIVKERMYRDKVNPQFLVNEITTFDNALTRPWTVIKHYQLDPSPRPDWRESVCAENNNHLKIGGDDYMLSADGLLMPVRKDQAPPDLRHFNQPRK
jgi:hypothetical protein